MVSRDFPIGISTSPNYKRQRLTMVRDIAIRLDGMLLGARGDLDGIAHYMKNNLSPSEYSRLIKCIGESMAALGDLSNALYSEFPDIVPKELRPSKAPQQS